MLSPQEIERLSENLIDVYQRIEEDLLVNIIKGFRVGVDKMSGTEQWRLEKLMQLGAVRKDSIRTIAKATGDTQAEVQFTLKAMGLKTLETDEPIYQAAFTKGLLTSAPLPIDASPNILRVIHQAATSMNEYLNLVNTTALQATMKAYTDIINQTYLEVETGISTYTESITKAVRNLADEGITGADYVSKAGRRTRNNIDVAVRRGIMTAGTQLTGKIQETRAKEWGSNLVEVTSHMGARPSHAEWQGRIFSLEGATPEYPNLAAVTGYGTGAGLKGYNCMHDFYPFFKGISEQTYHPYSIEQNNARYEATQVQRGLERDIRQQKRRLLAAQKIGDTDGEAAAKTALRAKQKQIREHIQKTGLDRQPERERVVV